MLLLLIGCLHLGWLGILHTTLLCLLIRLTLHLRRPFVLLHNGRSQTLILIPLPSSPLQQSSSSQGPSHRLICLLDPSPSFCHWDMLEHLHVGQTISSLTDPSRSSRSSVYGQSCQSGSWGGNLLVSLCARGRDLTGSTPSGRRRYGEPEVSRYQVLGHTTTDRRSLPHTPHPNCPLPHSRLITMNLLISTRCLGVGGGR
jgi:hypothetical protein